MPLVQYLSDSLQQLKWSAAQSIAPQHQTGTPPPSNFIGQFPYSQSRVAKGDVLQARWAAVLRVKSNRSRALAYALQPCRHPSPPFGRSAWRLCDDLGDLQAPQYDVGKSTGPPDEGCLVVSIGIGNSWQFEDAMAYKGCAVHAFDPTHELFKAHAKHVHDRPRMRFYFLGLGGGGSSASGDGTSGVEMYGAVSKNRLRPLDHLLSVAREGRERRAIDVLKIDCEGCEFAAFADLERRTPQLLVTVQYLLIELHMTPRYGLHEVAQLNLLMSHLVDRHGFRLFRKPRTNRGFPWARNETLPALVRAGLDPIACCVELHFMRRNHTNAFRSHADWLRRMDPSYAMVASRAITRGPMGPMLYAAAQWAGSKSKSEQHAEGGGRSSPAPLVVPGSRARKTKGRKPKP